MGSEIVKTLLGTREAAPLAPPNVGVIPAVRSKSGKGQGKRGKASLEKTAANEANEAAKLMGKIVGIYSEETGEYTAEERADLPLKRMVTWVTAANPKVQKVFMAALQQVRIDSLICICLITAL